MRKCSIDIATYPFIFRDSAPPGIAQEGYDVPYTGKVAFYIGRMCQSFQDVTICTEARADLSRIGPEVTIFGLEVIYHLIWLGSFARQIERQERLRSIVRISK